MRTVTIKDRTIGADTFTLISGPCVIESQEHALKCAEVLSKLCADKAINLIFKSSYDKANRTSKKGFRGPGIDEGLKILEKIRLEFGIPVLTDVHSPQEARMAGQVCDIIQIPAFLCRQSDLLYAAGETSAAVNIKKGQFLSPWDMQFPVEKLVEMGKHTILLTERGSCFGYHNLVVDFRSLVVMQKLGYPVVFDATHSIQLPGGGGGYTTGQKEFIPALAAAALATGCDAIFAESHPEPAKAYSDAGSMLSHQELQQLIDSWIALYEQCHLAVSYV